MTECPSPPRMVAWFLDESDDHDLHVLECERCARLAAHLADLADGLVDIGKGKIPPILSPATLEALCKSARVSMFRGSPGDRIPCVLSRDLDYVVLRVAIPLADVSSLDVEFLGPDGRAHAVERDASFANHEVVIACSRHVAAAAPEVRIRLVAQPDGRDLGTVCLINQIP